MSYPSTLAGWLERERRMKIEARIAAHEEGRDQQRLADEALMREALKALDNSQPDDPSDLRRNVAVVAALRTRLTPKPKAPPRKRGRKPLSEDGNTTRLGLIAALRIGPATVPDLHGVVDVTDRCVRANLHNLEKRGIAERAPRTVCDGVRELTVWRLK